MEQKEKIIEKEKERNEKCIREIKTRRKKSRSGCMKQVHKQKICGDERRKKI